jgi:hypothetical protein
MNIVFDQKDYPSGIGSLAVSIKNELPLNDLMKIVDGQWSCRIGASWYSRTKNLRLKENPYSFSRAERFSGWHFYSNLVLNQAAKQGWGAVRGFAPEQSLEFIQGYAAAVIVSASVKSIWESPNDLIWEKREEIADLISKLDLAYPSLPDWAMPLPVAVFGEGVLSYRETIGSIFCVINDEFAAEVYFEARLHSRKPTSTEMQQLEEQLS